MTNRNLDISSVKPIVGEEVFLNPQECIHELFETQAEQTPDAVAVICEDNSLTYGALNQKANQVAHHLRKRGVGPEMIVGLSVERSVEMER